MGIRGKLLGFLSMSALVYFTGLVCAEDAPATVPAAPSKAGYVVLPSPLSLGEMTLESKQPLSFRIRNNSDRPLTVKSLRASCQCIELGEPPAKPIEPKQELEIRGQITANDKEGDARKIIYLHVDDPQEPIFELIVNVRFVKPSGPKLTLSGNELDFGRVPANEKRLAVLRVMNFGDSPLEVKEVVCQIPGLTVKLDSTDPIAPHQGTNLRAWFEPAVWKKAQTAPTEPAPTPATPAKEGAETANKAPETAANDKPAEQPAPAKTDSSSKDGAAAKEAVATDKPAETAAPAKPAMEVVGEVFLMSNSPLTPATEISIKAIIAE